MPSLLENDEWSPVELGNERKILDIPLTLRTHFRSLMQGLRAKQQFEVNIDRIRAPQKIIGAFSDIPVPTML